MRYVVYLMLLTLAILHHDFYWWETHEPLIFGFIPIGLAWHACISIGASLVGLMAIRFCWPEGLDDEGFEEGGPRAV